MLFTLQNKGILVDKYISICYITFRIGSLEQKPVGHLATTVSIEYHAPKWRVKSLGESIVI